MASRLVRTSVIAAALAWCRMGAAAPADPNGTSLAASAAPGEVPAAASLGLPPPRQVTLAQAVAYAREHQPAVLATLARLRSEQANATVPRAQYYPLLGVTAQFIEGTTNNTTASYLTDPDVGLPRIGGTTSTSGSDASWRPHPSTLAAAGLSQEIFDFGRIAAQSAAADARVVVAAHAAETQRLDIALNVEEAYFAVHAAKSILQASEDAYQRALVHRNFANAGVSSGLRSPIELTRAQADLSRFDTGRIRARGGVMAAQAVLAASVGVPELVLDAANELPGALELPTLTKAIQLASEREPRLAQALASLRQQELETRAVGALSRPDLHLSAAISGRAGGAPPSTGQEASGGGYAPDVPNWDGMLVFSWPLLDPVIDARQHAARVTEGVRRAEVDVVRQQLVASVEQAYLGVVMAREALPSLQRGLEAARANYAQADARFKAGLGTSVELADAEALRTDAEIRLALGTFDLAKARSLFGRAVAAGIS